MSDTDIHSCGYYCDRHACILRQRDELRDKLFEEIRTSERNIQTSDSKEAESSQPWVKTYSGGKPNYTQPIEQEPVAWMHVEKGQLIAYEDDKEECEQCEYCIPLYTAPQKKEWVGLTEDDLQSIYASLSVSGASFNTVALVIEAKLKEKNNG
jgi:hypothetical protein